MLNCFARSTGYIAPRCNPSGGAPRRACREHSGSGHPGAADFPQYGTLGAERLEMRYTAERCNEKRATIFSDMDAEIAALEAKLAKARQVKQGMMQELLTGRIRLVEANTARSASC